MVLFVNYMSLDETRGRGGRGVLTASYFLSQINPFLLWNGLQPRVIKEERRVYSILEFVEITSVRKGGVLTVSYMRHDDFKEGKGAGGGGY